MFEIMAVMAEGVKIGEELRSKLDGIRLRFRLSYEGIGRMTGLSHATIRKVIRKKGTAVRDVHRYSLSEFVEKVERGEITFGEDRKAIPAEGVTQP